MLVLLKGQYWLLNEDIELCFPCWNVVLLKVPLVSMEILDYREQQTIREDPGGWRTLSQLGSFLYMGKLYNIISTWIRIESHWYF